MKLHSPAAPDLTEDRKRWPSRLSAPSRSARKAVRECVGYAEFHRVDIWTGFPWTQRCPYEYGGIKLALFVLSRHMNLIK
jgi:hypothetical protein